MKAQTLRPIDKGRLSDLKRLQRHIRYNFRNNKLLAQALTHKSYAYEHSEIRLMNNERLEFLGDAVLDFAISSRIYQNFPDCQEGDLTRIKSTLVNRFILAKIAQNLGLGKSLLLGRGEIASGGAELPRNLGGAFEAVVGAIYLDGGLKKVMKFIESQFKDEIGKVMKNGARKDSKTLLQEYMLKTRKTTPAYKILSEKGPEHKKYFEVAVYFGGEIIGRGEGKNKKSAEQNAAYDALLKAGLI